MMRPTKRQEEAFELMKMIEALCIQSGFNLTVMGDKSIGFVDRATKRIIFKWSANYSMDEEDEE